MNTASSISIQNNIPNSTLYISKTLVKHLVSIINALGLPRAKERLQDVFYTSILNVNGIRRNLDSRTGSRVHIF